METAPLVDRREEMARLHQALDDLHSRKGALILLRGETGIGKSRLVEEALRVAAERGCAVSRGSSLSETMSIYFPWHEALRPLELEHVLEEAAPPSLLGLYLVTQAGLLVLKEERVSTAADAEIFSGMVTAVTEFMADALGKVGSTEGPVARMSSGSRGIVMRRGLAVREELGDKEGIASSLLALARVMHSLGDTAAALEHMERGMAILSEIGDRAGRIGPLSLPARMQLRVGRPEEARRAAEEAVALARESGERAALAGALLACALC